jgi:hypothetical protein
MMDTTKCGGRLGNRFFQNMVVDMIARLYNLPAKYDHVKTFEKLGFTFFTEGTNTFNSTFMITDENIYDVLDGKIQNTNFDFLDDVFFQNPRVSRTIKQNINIENVKSKNPFSNRYNNNNDVYIHVRKGDLEPRIKTPEFEQYDKILSSLSFNQGFISSDSINDHLVQKLVNKYKLNILLADEVQTIQFASTCKYIVTAGGTFSWMIAILGFYSTIFYPKVTLKWHGDIFVFPDWKEY